MNVAFDIDGTLLDEHDKPRKDIIALLKTLAKFKGVKVYVWSGSGFEYAQQRCRELGLGQYVDILFSKSRNEHIHVAFDDMDVLLGQHNINVNQGNYKKIRRIPRKRYEDNT